MSMMSVSQLGKLTPEEKVSVESFLQRLYRVYGDAIQQAILFGSKARGDSQPESDIDILIVVDDENWAMRDDISLIAAQESLTHNVLLGPRVIGQERWNRMARERFTLYENIAREGLALEFA